MTEKTHFISSAVIAPREVPEVQSLMKLCNEFHIPVWTFSAGRNVGYGGSAPRVRGSVTFDLGKNMNKIIEVNVDGAYAIVEPGVTFRYVPPLQNRNISSFNRLRVIYTNIL